MLLDVAGDDTYTVYQYGQGSGIHLSLGLLADGGLFAFSVEDLEAGESASETGFALRPSLRYAHSEAYVRELAEGKGFALTEISRTAIRDDGGKPVFGILFLAAKGKAGA